MDLFIDLLVDLTQDKRGNVARSGLEALTRLGLRKRAAELIPRLVRDDPSWIQVSAVSWHLHLHRQDLLTPFLSARVYKGRFPSGKAAFLPAFDSGFSRWTAPAAMLCRRTGQDLASTQRNAWELYGSVERYAAMPSIDLAPLVSLRAWTRLTRGCATRRWRRSARRRRTRRAGADAGAGRQPGPRRHLCLASILDEPAPVAGAGPARVPRGKVTVAKEIIRLAGDLRTDDAFAFLARIEGDGKLHPDVAIALMRAYWNFLEHPEVWQRLHAAARSEQPALARATIRIPPTGLSPDGQRALSRHLALLLGHADAQVRKETLERLIAMPPGEGEPSLIKRWPRSSMTSMSRELNSRPALLGIHARNQPRELASSFAAATRAQSLAAIVNSYRRQTRSGLLELGASASLLVEPCWPGAGIRDWRSGWRFRY